MDEQLTAITASEEGVMEFTEEEILTIQAELNEIIDNFEPDAYTVTPTIQYITAEYNANHVGEEINGDTVQYILGYVKPQDEQPVAE